MPAGRYDRRNLPRSCRSETAQYDWPDDWAYRKYELGWLRDDGQPGFNTNTGRCELYNTLFEAWGFDPLPYYDEPPESPVSTPELFEEYPYVLTTGARTWEYFHSGAPQLEPRLRESHPDRWSTMHPDTAAEYRRRPDGDWVWVETTHARLPPAARCCFHGRSSPTPSR